MEPKGFWSYARDDDEHLAGALSRLRQQIAGEVAMLLGRDVDMFQDIRDVRTGERWAERIRAELTAATFLVPVLTPRYLNRPWCREETLTFLRLAREKGIEPNIFPIRFVEYDEDPGCELRQALSPFQYKDFTQWRFESDPTRRDKLLNEFARDVKADGGRGGVAGDAGATADPGTHDPGRKSDRGHGRASHGARDAEVPDPLRGPVVRGKFQDDLRGDRAGAGRIADPRQAGQLSRVAADFETAGTDRRG
jgi:hypothetical protein